MTLPRSWLPLVVALLAAPVLAPRVLAGKAEKTKHVAKVSLEAARVTALARVPGTVRAEELEEEDGRWIYSFEIKPTGETRKIIKEVNVNADTGKIVDVETESE